MNFLNLLILTVVTLGKNDELRIILLKESAYKEPKTIDFERNRESVIENVKVIIPFWSKKENIAHITLLSWLNEFSYMIFEETEALKV